MIRLLISISRRSRPPDQVNGWAEVALLARSRFHASQTCWLGRREKEEVEGVAGGAAGGVAGGVVGCVALVINKVMVT